MTPFVPLASINAFVLSYTQSDLFGQLIILSLAGLSILSWVILSYKMWMFKKIKLFSEAYQTAVESSKVPLLTLESQSLAVPPTPGVSQPFEEIFEAFKHKTIEVLNKNHYFLTQGHQTTSSVHLTSTDLDLVESYLLSIISAQNKVLERNLYILATIIPLAPFIGLLGTVWGILVSFAGLQSGGSVGSNAAVLSGISTALAATVMGLLIAIPALIAYNHFRNTLRFYQAERDDFLTRLIFIVALQYKKVE
jgi:biopolymer transport protein TolQ